METLRRAASFFFGHRYGTINIVFKMKSMEEEFGESRWSSEKDSQYSSC